MTSAAPFWSPVTTVISIRLGKQELLWIEGRGLENAYIKYIIAYIKYIGPALSGRAWYSFSSQAWNLVREWPFKG